MKKDRKRVVEEFNPFGIPKSEMMSFMVASLIQMDVTPEEYKAIYDTINSGKGLNLLELMNRECDEVVGVPDKKTAFNLKPFKNSGRLERPMPDDNEKSLRLKIQMKDVSKPPMWREVIVPADFTFTQLHKTIQAVCNFGDAHLWNFQKAAYNSPYTIGIPQGYDYESITDDADEVRLTALLRSKSDKTTYVYDFGDDWIFDVSVLEVLPRHGEVAELVKWKSDLQPIEDCGGIWSYIQIRNLLSNSDLKLKELNKCAYELGYDSFKDLQANCDEPIDPEYIAEILANI